MKQKKLESITMNVAEVELVYRTKVKASERPAITSSQEVYRILLQNWDMDKIEFVEEFKVLLINRSNKVLGICNISTGGITGTVADPRLIYIAALRANAVSIIIAHNHPSGSLKPSRADEDLTYKIAEAGKLLDIRMLDHCIVTKDAYYSFADEGLL